MTTRRLTAALAAATTLALAGCGGGSSGTAATSSPASTSPGSSPIADTFSVSGDLQLTGPNSASQSGQPGEACVGTGGFADITANAQVKITGKSGQTVGLAKLGSGVVGAANAGTPQRTCEFHFGASDIPSGEGFYGVQVGNREGPQFPEDQISSTTISLTLGS